MKKKIIIIILVLLLSGCTQYNDINNISIISSISIEKENKNYLVNLKVLSSNQENKDNIYSQTCTKLYECFDAFNNQLMKKLYLTHLDLLVLSNNLEKEDYDNIVNFFINQKTSRNSFNTIIAETPQDILNYNTKDISNLLDLSIKTTGIVKKISFDEIIKDILNYKITYIPYINRNIEINSYKEIYEENKILSKDESLAINIIKNNINNITLLINKETYKLEECNTINKVNKDNITFNIECNYKGKKENIELIKNYFNTIINQLIENNNNNYIKYLIHKYTNKEPKKIKHSIKLNIKHYKDTGGEIFE